MTMLSTEERVALGDVLCNWQGKALDLSLCGRLPNGKHLLLHVDSCNIQIRENGDTVTIEVPRKTIAVMQRNR